jgi:hypothetical protein
MSKAGAMASIMYTLNMHSDLKQDLMNVLWHKDASWGPDDFETGQDTADSLPKFLEPSHQPQMTNPFWYPDGRDNRSIKKPTALGPYRNVPELWQLDHSHSTDNDQQNRWPIFQPNALSSTPLVSHHSQLPLSITAGGSSSMSYTSRTFQEPFDTSYPSSDDVHNENKMLKAWFSEGLHEGKSVSSLVCEPAGILAMIASKPSQLELTRLFLRHLTTAQTM